MTQYWYRTRVDYGQGSIYEYVSDEIPSAADYENGEILEIVRVSLVSLTALEIQDMLEGELESENYHSLTNAPKKLVKAIHSVVDASTTSKIMQAVYKEGVFNI